VTEPDSSERFTARLPDVSEPTLESLDRVPGLLRDLQGMGESAARIVARGEGAFYDEVDDTLRLATKALIIDVATVVAQLPRTFKQGHPTVPWHQISGLRNRLAHSYHDLSSEILWATVALAIPDLIELVCS